MKLKYILIILLLLFPFVVFSQEGNTDETDELENLDDLFSTPEEDIVVEEPEVDNRTQFESSEKIKFSGSFNAIGGISAGWNNWNFINNIAEGFAPSAGFESDFKLNLDIRPAPQLRLYGSLFTTFDAYALTEVSEKATEAVWTVPEFKDLYCDYIIADTLFTRFGKFTMGWGQGRFYTPGNLMSDSENSSLNFRFSLPTLFGMSFVLLSNKSVNYKDFTFAGKIDFVFGETMISPGVKYNKNEGVTTLLSLKQVLFKTDFLVDFTTNINNSLLQSVYVVSGFYHEWSDVKLYGEYQFSWLQSQYDHEASIAAIWSRPFGATFDLGIQFMQNFVDGSGTVTLGLNKKVLPYMEMKIALPIVYGSEGSSAVLKNEDPSGNRIGLLIALEIKTDF